MFTLKGAHHVRYLDHHLLSVCVCRYNISTAEYDGWDSSVNADIERVNAEVLDGPNDDVRTRVVSELEDVYEQFGFTVEVARQVCVHVVF